jgi:hypothetical protein
LPDELELNDAGELFDVLARYRIAQVTYDFACDYWRDGEMSNIEAVDTTFWVSDDLYIDGLPDDDGAIHDAISEFVKEIANDEYVGEVPGKIEEGGTVTFDVTAREISVTAEVEVTKTETFEETWSVEASTTN